jgi:hypothetical protein
MPLFAVTIDFTVRCLVSYIGASSNSEFVLLSHHELQHPLPRPRYSAHILIMAENFQKLVFKRVIGDRQKLPHDIKYLEGDFKIFPRALKQPLLDFCADNETRDVYVSRQQWYKQTLTEGPDGRSRKWYAVSTKEELRVGRFRYGRDRQVIVVQAKGKSNWQNGQPLIVVAKRNGSGKTGIYKIWRFQDNEEQIPERDHDVMYAFDDDIESGPSAPQLGQDGPQTQPNHKPNTSTTTGMDHSGTRGVLSSSTATQLRQQVISSIEDNDVEMDSEAPNDPNATVSQRRLNKSAPSGPRKPTKDSDKIAERKSKHGATKTTKGTSKAVVQALEEALPFLDQQVPRVETIESNNKSKRTKQNSRLMSLRATPRLGGPSITMPIRPSPSPSRFLNAFQDEPVKEESDTELVRTRNRSPKPTFNINSVRVFFVSKADEIVRQRSWAACSTLDRLFRQANAADIINESFEKLTAEVDGQYINLVREDEDDFEGLEQMIVRSEVKTVKIRLGTRRIR